MRRTIEVESSQFAAGAYWVYGGEYYAEDATIDYPEELDHLDDDTLLEMASNGDSRVHYVDDSGDLIDI